MLLSVELEKDNNNHNPNHNFLLLTNSTLLSPASYPKLHDFYSMAFFFLVLISMPSCIKNTITIFAPSGNTFAMFIKGVHVKDYSYYPKSRNKYYVS